MNRVASDWKAFVAGGPPPEARDTLRAHERTGRALGSDTFVTAFEPGSAAGSESESRAQGPSKQSEFEIMGIHELQVRSGCGTKQEH